jgi:hypothetical protein
MLRDNFSLVRAWARFVPRERSSAAVWRARIGLLCCFPEALVAWGVELRPPLVRRGLTRGAAAIRWIVDCNSRLLPDRDVRTGRTPVKRVVAVISGMVLAVGLLAAGDASASRVATRKKAAVVYGVNSSPHAVGLDGLRRKRLRGRGGAGRIGQGRGPRVIKAAKGGGKGPRPAGPKRPAPPVRPGGGGGKNTGNTKPGHN